MFPIQLFQSQPLGDHLPTLPQPHPHMHHDLYPSQQLICDTDPTPILRQAHPDRMVISLAYKSSKNGSY